MSPALLLLAAEVDSKRLYPAAAADKVVEAAPIPFDTTDCNCVEANIFDLLILIYLKNLIRVSNSISSSLTVISFSIYQHENKLSVTITHTIRVRHEHS